MQSVMNSMKWCAATAVFSVASASSLNAATITVPPVVVQSLTHTYTAGTSSPFPQPSRVRDFFNIGNIGSGYTGGGAFSVPSIANGDSVVVRIEAPAGKKFKIVDAATQLSFSLNWQTGSNDVISTSGGTVTFENFVGNAPTNTYSFLGVGNAGNAISTQLQYSALGFAEFTAINIVVPVQSSPAAGPRNFNAAGSSSSPAFSFLATGGTDRTIVQLATIPEPTALAALGGVSLIALRRRGGR